MKKKEDYSNPLFQMQIFPLEWSFSSNFLPLLHNQQKSTCCKLFLAISSTSQSPHLTCEAECPTQLLKFNYGPNSK